jgi:branched-chain amino acid transport system permease protein
MDRLVARPPESIAGSQEKESSMSELLLFLCLGIGGGALIAGLAASVVLSYRGSGVINIGTGAIAMFGAYLFYGLRTGGYLFFSWLPLGGWSKQLVPAILITLAIMAAFGALVDWALYRKLRQSPPLAKLVASIGILLTLQAVIVLRYGGDGQSAPAVISVGVTHLFGGAVPVSQFILIGVVIALAAGLAAVYKYSRFGLATRAVQESEAEAALAGLSSDRVSMINSVLTAVVAGGIGILVAPLTQLDPTTIALSVIPALGAALIANMTSFGVAVAAGLGMGAIESVITYVQTKPWFPQAGGLPLPGVAQVVFFLIIAVTLMTRGSALPQRGALAELHLPAAPSPRNVRRTTVILVAIVALAFLVLPWDFRQATINTMIGATIALSLVVLTGLVGQVSIAQLALGGVAGFATARFSARLGLDFPVGPILGVLIAVAFGLVAAIPALRVRGVNLALITLAGAVAIEDFGFDNLSWGGGANGTPVPAPHLFGVNIGPAGSFPVNAGSAPSPVFCYVCLVIVTLVALLVAGLRRTAYGHMMLSVRSSERASAAIGLSPRRVKLLAFGLSAGIAGIAGVLYSYNFSSVDADNFGIANGLALIGFAYIGGVTTIEGAITCGMLITEGIMSHISEKYIGIPINYQNLFAGVALLATIVINPGGIALAPKPQWPHKLARFARRLAFAGPPGGPGTPAVGDGAPAVATGRPALAKAPSQNGVRS